MRDTIKEREQEQLATPDEDDQIAFGLAVIFLIAVGFFGVLLGFSICGMAWEFGKECLTWAK